MQTIQTKVATISYDSRTRIVCMKLNDGAQIELENAIENRKAALNLTNYEKHLLIVDARNKDVYVSKEAREYSAKYEAGENTCMARAFIVNSIANRLIGNFYINFNKPKIPTKLFLLEEEALEWLNGFLYLTESDIV